MAERKPLYMTSDGYHLEMSDSVNDSLELGGLTLGGDLVSGLSGATITELGAATEDGDVLSTGQSGANLAGLTVSDDINMVSQKITGLGAPTDPNDAATLDYVDNAAIAAGHFREALLHNDQLDTTHGIFASAAFYCHTQPTTGTMTLTDGSTTRTYSATGQGGDVTFALGSFVVDSMTNLAAAIDGDGSGVWDAVYLPDGGPLDEINPNSDGIVIVTEKSTATGVSCIGQSSASFQIKILSLNGEPDYTTKTITDPPTGAGPFTYSHFGFRRTLANLVDGELHLMLEDEGAYSWDDSGNAWNLISGAGAIPDATAGSGGGTKGKVGVDSDLGLDVSSGILEVDLYSSGSLVFDSSNKGIEVGLESSNPSLKIAGNELGVKFAASGSSLEAGAVGLIVSIDTAGAIVRDGVNDGLELNLASSNPGLQINGSNELGVKYSSTLSGLMADAGGLSINLEDSTPTIEESGSDGIKAKFNTSVGIDSGSSGLTLKIDDTPDTLDMDSDGLKVVGVPAEFKINGTAIAAGITHTILNLLTDGSSNADAYHTHTAIEVNEAQRIENDINVAALVNGGRAVRISASNVVQLASSASGAVPIGIAITGQASPGYPTNVVSKGNAVGILSSATPGTPYYLNGTSGQLSTSMPSAGSRIVQMGVARTATDLWVDIIDYGKKAA